MFRHLTVLLIFVTVHLGFAPRVYAMPDSLHKMLAKYMRFTQHDLQAVKQGKLIAKPLETGAKQELAFFGVTYVKAPPSLLVERFRDIETFKSGEAVLKVKKISNSPSQKDFAQMTLQPDDLRELKKCKPGHCDMKLSDPMIEKFQATINWKKPDAPAKATELYRDLLLEYVQTYLSQGNSALMDYHDRVKPVSLANEFQAILKASPYLLTRIPEFYEYQKNFAQQPLKDVENFLYWSKETLKFRPVITITHVSMYRPNPREAIFASKQIYANHYMTGSLALTMLVSDNEDPKAPGFYLLYINRSRTDMLGGLLSGLKRSLARSRSTSALGENLLKIKLRLEKEFASTL